MVRARSDRTFGEPMGIAYGTREEEGRKDEMGYRSKRIKETDDQRQPPLNEDPDILHSLQGRVSNFPPEFFLVEIIIPRKPEFQ